MKPIAILLLLIPLSFCSNKLKLSSDFTPCENNEYYDEDTNSCKKCSMCTNFHFEYKPCTANQDTVCEWCGNKDLFSLHNEINYEDSDKASNTQRRLLESFNEMCLFKKLEFIKMQKLEEMFSNEDEDDSSDSMEITPIDENDERVKELIEKYQLAQRSADVKFVKKSDILKSLKEIFPLPDLPIDDEEEYEDDDDLSEDDEGSYEPESNEGETFNDVEWDNWVDDRVKPLKITRVKIQSRSDQSDDDDDDVQIVSAEEIPENDVIVLDGMLTKEETMDAEMNKKFTEELRCALIWRAVIVFITLTFAISIVLFIIIKRKRSNNFMRAQELDNEILFECGKNARLIEKDDDAINGHINPLYSV